jgi:hypothetical protein
MNFKGQCSVLYSCFAQDLLHHIPPDYTASQSPLYQSQMSQIRSSGELLLWETSSLLLYAEVGICLPDYTVSHPTNKIFFSFRCLPSILLVHITFLRRQAVSSILTFCSVRVICFFCFHPLSSLRSLFLLSSLSLPPIIYIHVSFPISFIYSSVHLFLSFVFVSLFLVSFLFALTPSSFIPPLSVHPLEESVLYISPLSTTSNQSRSSVQR